MRIDDQEHEEKSVSIQKYAMVAYDLNQVERKYDYRIFYWLCFPIWK